jgi:lysophospholipase L1-like esterase
MEALASHYTNAGKTIIGTDGWTVTIDAKVCRKSTTPGCLHGKPGSALDVLRTRQNRQNTVVVIMVGHNDDRGTTFRNKVETILAEVRDAPQVFWISMREVSKSYAAANQAIAEAAARFPNVQVIPWDEASRHQSSWVARDGTHLTAAGAKHMAMVIRQSLDGWVRR